MDERFEKLVDPDGVLDPHERAVRAETARRAHFLQMAARSAAVRRAKRAAAPAEPEGQHQLVVGWVARQLESAPELTVEQRGLLRRLLRPAGRDDGLESA
jgi:hypothetical protein